MRPHSLGSSQTNQKLSIEEIHFLRTEVDKLADKHPEVHEDMIQIMDEQTDILEDQIASDSAIFNKFPAE
jgi:hypothetical protein